MSGAPENLASAADAQHNLRFGPVGDALHVVIDLQRLFVEDSEWKVSGIPAILPAVGRLLDHAPNTAAYARFIPPPSAELAHGIWRDYYRHWNSVTTDQLAPGLLEVLPALAHRAPTSPILDKSGYSVFSSPAFRPLIAARGITTLILSGVETDVCVLATVMEAVDLGLRVIIAQDGVVSGSPEGHAAAMTILRIRFDQQVEIVPVDRIIASWATP